MKQQKQTKTIAVLPFVNMSSSQENEYFSDGMTEEIINALAKIKSLKVTSRTSSFFFKNKKIPIIEIGEALNVSTVLEGSVRLSGNQMRITAQLIDVAEDFHFWSETFDRTIDNIFAVQDEISLLIADKLRENIGHFEIAEHLVENAEIPLEIYKKYLKGRFHLMKLGLADTEQGIAILKEVVAEQPNFALPYLGINQAYAYLGTMGLIAASQAFAKAKPFLDKAIELNEDLPESQLNLAWIACWQNWDLDATYRHLNKALEIRPSDQIYLTMANTLSVEGKFDAALNYVDKALQLDPFSPMNHHFKGFIFYLQEKYEKAIPHFEKSLSLSPNLSFPKLYWGQSLLLMGKKEDGLEYFQNFPEDKPGELTKLGGMTLAYSALGNIEKAEKGIEELTKLLGTEAMGSAMFFLIQCQTLVDRKAEAIRLIAQGINTHLPIMLLLYTEPIVKPLRSLPSFQALMKQALGEKSTFDVSKRKYKKSLLSKTLLNEYSSKLETFITTEKPYLDSDLTLRILAEMLDIQSNHLSQLLNEGFNKNFAEYINSYRLEAFKTNVANPKLRHLTILGLAYESGFNSKTVFNTFFKKTMGMTPKSYWKTIVQ
jgi:TolB-like protein/AraC-like DNA-binding protein/predicted Zn-dependent protease